MTAGTNRRATTVRREIEHPLRLRRLKRLSDVGQRLHRSDRNQSNVQRSYETSMSPTPGNIRAILFWPITFRLI